MATAGDGGDVKEATQPGRGLSRRKMIAAAATALGGTAAAEVLMSSEADAATGKPLLLGEQNTAGATTSLEGPASFVPAFEVTNPGRSGGVAAAGNAGLIGSVGPYALTVAPLDAGVVGWSSLFPNAYGVLGTGLTGAESVSFGVVGVNSLALVTGAGSTGAGVVGVVGAFDEFGLTATGLPAGIQGMGTTPGSIGVSAINSQNGVALQVHGVAEFSTSGQGTIPASAASVEIADPGVTSTSKILVSPNANPGAGQQFWVTSVPGTGFVVHRSSAGSKAVPFSYFRIG